MKRLIPKKWRATFISLLFARLTLHNWRAKLISLILATMLWYLIKKNLETTSSPSEPRERPTATERR
jgi:YbbR domain-containing protein